jgi:hypothetical protein
MLSTPLSPQNTCNIKTNLKLIIDKQTKDLENCSGPASIIFSNILNVRITASVLPLIIRQETTMHDMFTVCHSIFASVQMIHLKTGAPDSGRNFIINYITSNHFVSTNEPETKAYQLFKQQIEVVCIWFILARIRILYRCTQSNYVQRARHGTGSLFDQMTRVPGSMSAACPTYTNRW